MEALVAAVKPLLVPGDGTKFSFEQSTPPSLPAAVQSSLLSLVVAANSACAGLFADQLKSLLPPEDKLTLLRFACRSILSSVCHDGGEAEWLGLLKILARTQSDLDDTVCAAEFIRHLVDNIVKHAPAAGEEEGAIRSQSLRLLLNLCIVDKDRVHQAFGCEAQRNVPLFGRIVEKKPTSESPVREFPALVPFVQALGRTVNTAQEPDATFFFVRILMFVLIRVPLARAAIEQANLYEILVNTFLHYSSGAKLGVSLRDSSASSASASASSSSSGASFEGTPESNLKLSLELLKLLANHSMLDEELPTCHVRLVSEGKEAVYKTYLARLAAILALGVEIPAEVLEGYEGDPVAKAAAGTLMPAAAPAPTAAEVAELGVGLEDVTLDDRPRPATPTSVAKETQSQASVAASPAAAASSSAHFSTAPPQAPANFVPVQRQQTRILLAAMAAESEPGARASGLVDLKRDVSHLMIGEDGQEAIPLLEADGCRAFHGLMQLLHRSLVLAGSNKKDGELLLAPILSALSPLVKTSAILRAHAKRCIFLDLASPPKTVDGKPYKKADGSNYAMTPAGAVSEKITDPDPLSLKSLILQWIITLNFNLKQNVSEFLYRVCAEDTSEYIRLLGFGNAVGLLAEKGLPGFGMLKQQSVNMDELLKSGKKL
jgi:hypothetical protein